MTTPNNLQGTSQSGLNVANALAAPGKNGPDTIPASSSPNTPASNAVSSNDHQPLALKDLEEAASKTGTYSGALIMTAPIVPVVAALISAIAYIAHWPQGVMLPDWLAGIIGTPLLLGTIFTLIAWLLLAIIIRRFTAVDRMSMGSYGQLLSRLAALNSQLTAFVPEPTTLPTSAAMAREEMDVLNPKNLLSGLIVAAIFGLTPSLLITRLQDQTETYKSDLKSTTASQGQNAKTTNSI